VEAAEEATGAMEPQIQVKCHEVYGALNRWEKGDFKYGTKDCVSFTVFMIRELYGLDYSDQITYQSELQAYRIIKKHGGFENLIDSVLGEPSDVSCTGDPVMFNHPISGLTMGVKLDEWVIATTKKGLTRVPCEYIVRVWKCRRF